MSVLLVSPVGSVLTDPGPLCAGRTVVLNCTGGQGHDWMYLIHHQLNLWNYLVCMQFTFSQLSPFPNDLITQLYEQSGNERQDFDFIIMSLSNK